MNKIEKEWEEMITGLHKFVLDRHSSPSEAALATFHPKSPSIYIPYLNPRNPDDKIKLGDRDFRNKVRECPRDR